MDKALEEVATRPKASLAKLIHRNDLEAKYAQFTKNWEFDRAATLENIRYHAWMEYPETYNDSLSIDDEYVSTSDFGRLRNLLVHIYLNPEANISDIPDGKLVERFGGIEKAREYASYAKYYIQDHDLNKKYFILEKHWTKVPTEDLMADAPDYIEDIMFGDNLGSEF